MQYHHIALCIKKLIIIISYHYIVPWPQNRTTEPYHCTVPWPQNRTIVPHHDLKTVPSNRTPFQASKFTPTLKIHKSIYLSIFLSICKTKTKKICETSLMFEYNNVQNEIILRGVYIFWTWQHPKRSNSARLRQFLNLTASKTKQFCETSFKNGKLSAELTASYQCVLRFFQSTCLKYCACQGKLMPGHTKCCTCHAKSS